MGEKTTRSDKPVLGWRVKLGAAIFVLSILLPVAGVALYRLAGPRFYGGQIYYALGGDFLFLSGLSVLGGEFWDKIRSLFIHDATIRF